MSRDFTDLRRVQTDLGSHIDPPLNQWWPKLDQLRWKAAVCSIDCGFTVKVGASGYWIGRRLQRNFYDVSVPNSSAGPFTFSSAWDYINGIETGAFASRQAVSP